MTFRNPCTEVRGTHLGPHSNGPAPRHSMETNIPPPLGTTEVHGHRKALGRSSPTRKPREAPSGHDGHPRSRSGRRHRKETSGATDDRSTERHTSNRCVYSSPARLLPDSPSPYRAQVAPSSRKEKRGVWSRVETWSLLSPFKDPDKPVILFQYPTERF